MPRSHDIILQETLDFMRAHLSETLDLSAISKHVHCSKSWLQKLFMKLTGKGPIAHLMELRIEKAKDLLRNTRLNISEVAIASGFNTQAYFGIAFRKATQLSPSSYREQVRKTQDSADSAAEGEQVLQIWFSDSMRSDALADRWNAAEGEWAQETDCVCGTGDGNVSVDLKRLLPDNFRLSLEFRLEGYQGNRPALFAVYLCDPTQATAFYAVSLQNAPSIECTMLRRDITVQENAYAGIEEGAWHKVDLTLNNETFLLGLDGVQCVSFQDPFPAPYAKRCRLRLHTWRSRLSLRNVRIEDLGFLPFGRTVRQADALYNSGLLREAQTLYQRMLDTQANPADITELHCKLSLCSLGQNNFAQAREWALKVPEYPLSDLWVQQAALVQLETDWREGKIQQMLARIALLSPKPQIRCRLRGITQLAVRDFDNRGFFEQGLLLNNSLLAAEKEDAPAYSARHAWVCESLLNLNRFESAVVSLRELTNRKSASHSTNEREVWLFTLADTLNFLGRPAESKTVIDELRLCTCDHASRARCDVYEAFCLRTEGRNEEALAALLTVPGKHPKAKMMAAFALLSASSIAVALGKPDQAFSLVAEVENSQERDWFLGKGNGSRYKYPPYLAKDEYARAAEALLEDSSVDDPLLALHAGQAVKAALVLALSNEVKESQKILKEVVRRYPEARVRYYAALARALEQGMINRASPGWASAVVPHFEKFPYPAHIRSEMFYLAGLLFLKEGETSQGQALLRRCVAEDTSCLWPAVLAKEGMRC